MQTAQTDTNATPDANVSLVDELLAGVLDVDNEPAKPSFASFADAVGAEPTEIIEPATDLAADPSDDIDAALDQIDAALNASATEETPAADPAPAPAKPKRQKKAAAPKEPKQPKAPKEPKPAPEPKAPRVTYHGNAKSAVLDNRVGGKTADMLVLEYADAALSPEELAAKQAAIREELDTKIAKKVAEKAIMLFKDIAAGVPVQNEVMRRAFTVLARDGFMVSGDKGNVQAELITKYSIGTTRSQANQMFCLFPFLKITVRDGKGRQVPNPDSTILPVVLQALDLQLKAAE